MADHPDFQRFADRIKRAIEYADRNGAASEYPVMREIHVTAERHARLLQQIWEWANSQTCKPSEAYIAVDPTLDHDPLVLMANKGGIIDAKAHVRSLLVGPAGGEVNAQCS